MKIPNEAEWHTTCILKFFNEKKLPDININEKTLNQYTSSVIKDGYTVPGVQKKASLNLEKHSGNTRPTLQNYNPGYILKPPVTKYPYLPELEHFGMLIAKAIGIKVVPQALITSNSQYSYITKRTDHAFCNDHIEKIAMEDFYQLSYRLTQYKYQSSYEKCAKIIDKYSSSNGLDISELFIRVLFYYIIGNADMHLKNLSMIETFSGSNTFIFSPAYDILPVHIIFTEDKEELALEINGKKRNLRKNDFITFGITIGIPDIALHKMMNQLLESSGILIYLCQDSLLPDSMKKSFIDLINTIIKNLQKS